jgi:hypothetical protein
MNDATPVQPAGIAWTYPKVSWVGPVGLEPRTRGLKGRRIATTVASTCDYVLTASPTSPTSGAWLTSFDATNHATRVARSCGMRRGRRKGRRLRGSKAGAHGVDSSATRWCRGVVMGLWKWLVGWITPCSRSRGHVDRVVRRLLAEPDRGVVGRGSACGPRNSRPARCVAGRSATRRARSGARRPRSIRPRRRTGGACRCASRCRFRQSPDRSSRREGS